jgi:hypothetical protein
VTDDQRILEKKALRNVRALFEILERDDLLKRKRQTRALWIASVPIAVLLVALASPKGQAPLDEAAKQRRSCEIDAWNARAGDFERRMRKDNPEMPYRDVQKRLEHERPALMAEAAAACNSNAR